MFQIYSIRQKCVATMTHCIRQTNLQQSSNMHAFWHILAHTHTHHDVWSYHHINTNICRIFLNNPTSFTRPNRVSHTPYSNIERSKQQSGNNASQHRLPPDVANIHVPRRAITWVNCPPVRRKRGGEYTTRCCGDIDDDKSMTNRLFFMESSSGNDT